MGLSGSNSSRFRSEDATGSRESPRRGAEILAVQPRSQWRIGEFRRSLQRWAFRGQTVAASDLKTQLVRAKAPDVALRSSPYSRGPSGGSANSGGRCNDGPFGVKQ